MKALMIATLALVLVGCGSNPIVLRSTQQVVVMPEEVMFNCPAFSSFPETSTLTDVQVARLIVQLYQNNVLCKNSMTSLRQFLENAQRTINAQP